MSAPPASHLEVGIRELRDGLSRFLVLVAGGAEVVVTDRGRPVARLVAHAPSRLDRLIERGIARPPRRPKLSAAEIPRVRATGDVSGLVSEQRR